MADYDHDYDVEPGSWYDSCEILWEFIDSRLEEEEKEEEDEAKTKSWLRSLERSVLLDVCGYYHLHRSGDRKNLSLKVLPYLLQTLKEEREAASHFGKW